MSENGKVWRTIYYHLHRAANHKYKKLMVSTLDPRLFFSGKRVDPGVVVIGIKNENARIGFSIYRDSLDALINALLEARQYLDKKERMLEKEINKK